MEKCDCGSGYEREAEYDARDIFLCYACPRCRKKKLSKYRPEVLSDSRYEADEDVDGEYDPHVDGPHPEDPDFFYEPEFAGCE